MPRLNPESKIGEDGGGTSGYNELLSKMDPEVAPACGALLKGKKACLPRRIKSSTELTSKNPPTIGELLYRKLVDKVMGSLN